VIVNLTTQDGILNMVTPPVSKVRNQSENYSLRQNHELGFLVALLVFLILQFVFFYFGLPQLTNAIKKSDPLPSPKEVYKSERFI